MLIAHALDRLEEHQDRIVGLIGEARHAVLGPVATAREELARVRWQMLRAMREYQIFKHSEIFDPVIASPDALRVASARRLKTSCIAASERYRQHTLRWSTQGIAAAWPAYVLALEETCRAIEGHLADERDLVALLLTGVERTRYR